MKAHEIEGQLLDLFQLVLRRPVDRSAVRQDIPEWDSLKHMQIIFGVEERFGVIFQEEDIPAMNSIQSLINFIIKQHEA